MEIARTQSMHAPKCQRGGGTGRVFSGSFHDPDSIEGGEVSSFVFRFDTSAFQSFSTRFAFCSPTLSQCSLASLLVRRLVVVVWCVVLAPTIIPPQWSLEVTAVVLRLSGVVRPLGIIIPRGTVVG